MDRRLLAQAGRARPALVLTILLGFLGGLLLIAQAQELSTVVNRVFLSGANLATVRGEGIALLVIFLLRAVALWGEQVSAKNVALEVKKGLRAELFAHLLALGPAFVQDENSGELSNTLTEGVQDLDAYFSQYLPQIVLSAAVPLTVLAAIFPRDWISALVLLLTAPLVPLFMILIGRNSEVATRRQWGALSQMSAYFLDTLQGITALKNLGRSQARLDEVATVSERYRQVTMRVLRSTFLSALVLELISTISVAVVAVEIGLRLLYGQLLFQPAFFILILAPEFYLPFRNLGLRFHASMSGVQAAQRIFQILDQPVPTAPTSPAQAPEAERTVGLASMGPVSPGGDGHREVVTATSHIPSIWQASSVLRCQDVHYRYPNREEEALSGVSFELHAGKTLALVGESGAGKSTLAQLVLRFIRPIGGRMTLDERPIDEIPLDTWRASMAWVPQRPYLFHASLRENLCLGSTYGEQSLWSALEQAFLAERVRTLPAGLDTDIGEGGARLSSGEAQRLALARAYLRDAPLLIMDEPTAHLDALLEEQLRRASSALFRGRAVLVIAHRLETVLGADQILVLHEGRAVEVGRHAELMARKGWYAQMMASYVE